MSGSQTNSPPASIGDDFPALRDRALMVLRPEGSGEWAHCCRSARVRQFVSPVELIEALEGERRPVVLLSPGTVGEHDLEVILRLADLPSHPWRIPLGGERTLAEAVIAARRLEVPFVFPEDCLLHPHELDRWLGWIDAGGPEPGLEAHLEPGTEIHRREILKREDKSAVVDDVLDFVREFNGEPGFEFDIRLIMEELINNAVFHAFLDERGNEKYNVGSFERFDDDERVRLSFGRDARTFGLSVSDNQGRLSRDTVLSRLERQMSVKGLLDESGRGIYLTWSLSRRMLWNLSPGSLTEAVTLFPTSPDAWPDGCAVRPILINEK